jgi:hypothetical protein
MCLMFDIFVCCSPHHFNWHTVSKVQRCTSMTTFGCGGGSRKTKSEHLMWLCIQQVIARSYNTKWKSLQTSTINHNSNLMYIKLSYKFIKNHSISSQIHLDYSILSPSNIKYIFMIMLALISLRQLQLPCISRSETSVLILSIAVIPLENSTDHNWLKKNETEMRISFFMAMHDNPIDVKDK